MSDIITNGTEEKSTSHENTPEPSGSTLPPEAKVQKEVESDCTTSRSNENGGTTISADIGPATLNNSENGIEQELEGAVAITTRINTEKNDEATQKETIDTTRIPVTIPRNTEHRADINDYSSSNALKECTVKEILNGILDCKVLRTPSTRDVQFLSSSAREEVPEGCPTTSSHIPECPSSKMVSVKEILGEILDYTVFRRSTPVQHIHNAPVPTTSQEPHNHICQTELQVLSRGYHVLRASETAGIINSSSALHSESYVHRPLSMKSVHQILPSYSTVLRLGPKRSMKSVESFIPRLPPPSYAEVEGLWEDSPTLISSESVIFGPDPMYIVCPGCRTVVITDVERQRSNVTHLVALILCLFFCWPCCLLPYCLKSCNYSYHSCPNCRHYFGVYNPF